MMSLPPYLRAKYCGGESGRASGPTCLVEHSSFGVANVQIARSLGRKARHHGAMLGALQVHKLALLLPRAWLALAAGGAWHRGQSRNDAARSGNGLHEAQQMRVQGGIERDLCAAVGG